MSRKSAKSLVVIDHAQPIIDDDIEEIESNTLKSSIIQENNLLPQISNINFNLSHSIG